MALFAARPSEGAPVLGCDRIGRSFSLPAFDQNLHDAIWVPLAPSNDQGPDRVWPAPFLIRHACAHDPAQIGDLLLGAAVALGSAQALPGKKKRGNDVAPTLMGTSCRRDVLRGSTERPDLLTQLRMDCAVPIVADALLKLAKRRGQPLLCRALAAYLR